jgi:hypothetical protein
MDGLDALDLDYDQVFYEQVDSIAQVEFLAFVNHGQTDLGVHVKTLFAELVGQAGVVGALQQTGSEDGMHLHRGTDDGGRDLVYWKSWDDGWAGHFFIFIHLLRAWM